MTVSEKEHANVELTYMETPLSVPRLGKFNSKFVVELPVAHVTKDNEVGQEVVIYVLAKPKSEKPKSLVIVNKPKAAPKAKDK